MASGQNSSRKPLIELRNWRFNLLYTLKGFKFNIFTISFNTRSVITFGGFEGHLFICNLDIQIYKKINLGLAITDICRVSKKVSLISHSRYQGKITVIKIITPKQKIVVQIKNVIILPCTINFLCKLTGSNRIAVACQDSIKIVNYKTSEIIKSLYLINIGVIIQLVEDKLIFADHKQHLLCWNYTKTEGEGVLILDNTHISNHIKYKSLTGTSKDKVIFGHSTDIISYNVNVKEEICRRKTSSNCFDICKYYKYWVLCCFKSYYLELYERNTLHLVKWISTNPIIFNRICTIDDIVYG